MDIHVPRAITIGLRLRGVDVLTAQEDGYRTSSDDRLLDRATELQRDLFSQAEDLLAEAKLRQVEGKHFTGLIYAHQLGITIDHCVQDLELVVKGADGEELANPADHLWKRTLTYPLPPGDCKLAGQFNALNCEEVENEFGRFFRGEGIKT